MAKIAIATAASAATTFVRDKATTNAAVLGASSSSSLRMVDMSNTGNSTAAYLKLYNLAAASVVFHAATAGSSTNPYIQIKAPASRRVVVTISTADCTFATALSFAVLTTGGTLGTTAMSAVNEVRLLLA